MKVNFLSLGFFSIRHHGFFFPWVWFSYLSLWLALKLQIKADHWKRLIAQCLNSSENRPSAFIECNGCDTSMFKSLDCVCDTEYLPHSMCMVPCYHRLNRTIVNINLLWKKCIAVSICLLCSLILMSLIRWLYNICLASIGSRFHQAIDK